MAHQEEGAEEVVGTDHLGEEDFIAEEAGEVVVADIEEEGGGIMAHLAVEEAGEVDHIVEVHQGAILMATEEAHQEVVEDLIKDHPDEVDFKAVELIKMVRHLLDHQNLKNTVTGSCGELPMEGLTSRILQQRK